MNENNTKRGEDYYFLYRKKIAQFLQIILKKQLVFVILDLLRRDMYETNFLYKIFLTLMILINWI